MDASKQLSSSPSNQYIQGLIAQAEVNAVKSCDNSIPLHRYIAAANQLHSQAQTAIKDDEQKFIFFTRFVNLVVNVILKHNSATLVQYKRDIFELKEKTRKVFDQLDLMKEMLVVSRTSNNDRNNTSSNNSNNDRLPTITMNRRMIDEFLSYSFEALEKGIEFCGILSGHYTQDGNITVTHLLLPKQSGTSDSCQADNEVELFDYQMNNGIITVGWIHTHPTQSAFLSAVDLRTQMSYQSMFPHAIAIVCAPRFAPKNLGIFRIDQMDYLRSFMSKYPDFGKDHRIPIDRTVYRECSHVNLSYHVDAPFAVIDFRANTRM